MQVFPPKNYRISARTTVRKCGLNQSLLNNTD